MPTPFEMRAELVDLLNRDLLGPANGPEEELDPNDTRVSSRYLLGALAPGGQGGPLDMAGTDAGSREAEAESSAIQVEDGSGEPIEKEPVLVDSLLPSSAGFSCLVDAAETELLIRAAWGRYEKADARGAEEMPAGKKASGRQTWKRFPVRPEPVLLKLREENGECLLEADQAVKLAWRVRKRADAWYVTLFIINAAPKKFAKKDGHWIFQTRLEAESPAGRPVFLPLRYADSGHAHLDMQEAEELESLDLRYGHNLVFARGHGAAAKAKADPRTDHAVKIELCFLPLVIIPGQTPRTGDDDSLLAGMVLDMKELAAMSADDLKANLDKLINAYSHWSASLGARITNPASGDAIRRAAAETDAALRHMREGVGTLLADEAALAAFRFTNQAMRLQRIHTIYAQKAKSAKPQGREAKQRLLKAADVPENRSWRLFQLAFILANISDLADPLHSERSGERPIAELLWFGTGGGKTEAYLGLTAFTLAMRRLKPDLGGLDAEHGVGVFMRYTLRLLTLQQFQRAATLICACELLRRKDAGLWGSEPFRLGLWVGGKSTPNTLEAARRSLEQNPGAAEVDGSARQFSSCPWCGSKVTVKVRDGKTDPARCFTFCEDTDGFCPFTEKRELEDGRPSEGIPVMVVDEEIYRHPPALLIATVDKFARMPWKGESATLFGRVSGRCQRHGFLTPDIAKANGTAHKAWKNVPASIVESHPWLRPPDLIIQDELHLICGPLGSMTALYENAVDTLCEWSLDGKTVRPKIIASTATIRRAGEQIRRLFNRAVQVFPPPGVDSRDNFFAIERQISPESPGRAYLGICAIGYRMPHTLVRVYATVLAAAQLLYEKYGTAADPWMTAIGYFNSIRELAGMQRLVRDEVRGRLADNKNQRGLPGRKPIRSEELTSRQSSRKIPHILETLGHDIAAKGGPAGFYDVVLATNMISVGVDVDRLGLMIVQGQPKNTSEYIQATSRVGRSQKAPGLVLTVYNWARPRDLSHYEDFYGYHEAFQRHVEALSITPFAERAKDRGLAAVLVALVRLLDTFLNGNDSPRLLDGDDTLFQVAKSHILARAGEILQNNREIAELEKRLDKLRDEWLDKAHRNTEVGLSYSGTDKSAGLLASASKTGEPFACPNSLRDVEKTINLDLNTDETGLRP